MSVAGKKRKLPAPVPLPEGCVVTADDLAATLRVRVPIVEVRGPVGG